MPSHKAKFHVPACNGQFSKQLAKGCGDWIDVYIDGREVSEMQLNLFQIKEIVRYSIQLWGRERFMEVMSDA
jgi:hypothetical protein